jgi:hypothetical protein
VVNGARVFGNLPFGLSSPYLTVPVGENLIQVIPSGGSLEESPVVIEATLPFEGDTRTTIVASNALSAIEANVFADDTQIDKKGAKIRVGHLSADAPNVDVAVDGSAAKDAIVKDAAYQAVTEYLPVKPGKLDLEVRLAGTEDVALDIPAVKLAKGTNYSAYAIGSAADGTLQVVLLTDASK